MQIVINIPEDTYRYFRNGGSIGTSLMIENAIKNGTPLPERHGDLVDADAILEDPIGDTYKDLEVAEVIIPADTESEEE